MSLEDGLRFGVATATAVCLHPGTANFELDVMRAFLPQVQFLPYA
jgi:fructose-1-phosphate kinase PfkB-like protein